MHVCIWMSNTSSRNQALEGGHQLSRNSCTAGRLIAQPGPPVKYTLSVPGRAILDPTSTGRVWSCCSSSFSRLGSSTNAQSSTRYSQSQLSSIAFRRYARIPSSPILPVTSGMCHTGAPWLGCSSASELTTTTRCPFPQVSSIAFILSWWRSVRTGEGNTVKRTSGSCAAVEAPKTQATTASAISTPARHNKAMPSLNSQGHAPKV
mmetsp:Transcript_31125/g.55768  ORF Transcript_31125/g.55768 Transcript_31125/m.55768 type:complete len:206 (-) Transcript_31125:101-718(-)